MTPIVHRSVWKPRSGAPIASGFVRVGLIALGLVVLVSCRKSAPLELIVPLNYSTIQKAIDAAQAGDTVKIRPGVYDETLVLKSQVSLTGSGDVESVVIRADCRDGPVLTISDSGGIKLSSLTFEHINSEQDAGASEAHIPTLLLQSAQVDILGCIVKGGAWNGIQIEGISRVAVKGTNVRGHQGNGLDITGALISVDLGLSQFLENGGDGMLARGGAGIIAKGCLFARNAGNGVHIRQMGQLAEFDQCRFKDNNLSGFAVRWGGRAQLEKTTASGNRAAGVTIEGDGSTVLLHDNLFSSNPGMGIQFLDGAGGQAVGNTCADNLVHGVYVSGSETRPEFKGNTITGNNGCGFHYDQGASGRVIGNTISQNLQCAALISDSGTHPFFDGNTTGEESPLEIEYENGARPAAKYRGPNLISYPVSQFKIGLLFESKRFKRIERLIERIRKDSSKHPSGDAQLEIIYDYLPQGWFKANVYNPEKFFALLDLWEAEYPKSTPRRVTLAYAYLDRARTYKEAGEASGASEGWKKGFARDSGLAFETLLAAEADGAHAPEIYAGLIRAGMALGRPREDLREFFARGFIADPTYPPLYYNLAESMTPAWGGRPGEAEEFAAEAAGLSIGEGDVLYAKIVGRQLLHHDKYRFVKSTRFDYERAARGFETLLRKHPEALFYRNLSFLLACLNDDLDTARRRLDAIQSDWHPDVWKRADEFEAWKNWIETGAARPTQFD